MRFCTHCVEHNLLVKTANVKPTAMHKIFFYVHLINELGPPIKTRDNNHPNICYNSF